MTRTLTAIALAAALAASGCLQKETTSTMYLYPDGSLDWVVLERHVRSDESDAAKRAAEEFGYVDAVANDRHSVAQGLRALGGTGVRTRLLRDTRPFAVMVDARFDSLTTIFENALAGCGVAHEIRQTVEGDVTTWRLWVDFGVDFEHLEGQEDCGDSAGGLFDADDLTVLLESGTFTNAEGFVLSGGDTAKIDDKAFDGDALKKTNGQLVLSLSWTRAR